MSGTTFSAGEEEQILQTIEMFEVITESNPKDCQSLEILKEAYTKLGRRGEMLGVMRRLGDAYTAVGQYAAAAVEYEGILKENPEAEGVADLLREVAGKVAAGGGGGSIPGGGDNRDRVGVRMDDLFGQEATLIATDMTRFDSAEQATPARLQENDGNDALAKFLIQQRLVPEEIVQGAFERVKRVNRHLDGAGLATSLLDEVVRSRVVDMEALLCGILDRTKFAYAPIEYYEVDRHVVKMLPENLTLGRLIVPFDLVSRTVMVAMANPFDALGKEAVQQLLDYNIQWHLASPAAIVRVLRDAYNLDARD